MLVQVCLCGSVRGGGSCGCGMCVDAGEEQEVYVCAMVWVGECGCV